MNLKYFIIFIFAFLISTAQSATFNLDDFLHKNGKLMWNLNQEQLKIVSKLPLRSQDNFDNVLRYNIKETIDKVTLNKTAVPEVIFNFKQRKLQSAVISVYNRGDSGVWSEQSFNNAIAGFQKYLADFTKCTKPVYESRKLENFRIDSYTYKGQNGDFIIRYNRRGRFPEYIQIMIYPAGKAPRLQESLKANINRKTLSLNLIIEQNGDAYINIPMVNQGNKGYCVAATIERLMKYYGSNIDQQIIAQLAGTDAYRGTNVRTLYNALSGNDARLKIRVDKLMHDNTNEDVDDVIKFNTLYNNIAKKNKTARVNIKDFTKGRGRYRRINYSELMKNYDYEIYKSAKCRNARMPEKFNKYIKEYLDKGIPLVWITYVFDGMPPKGQIGRFSMHMRIINGYNSRNNSIIYTDSWGKGHEKKSLSLNDAWAHTLMLIAITPR